MKKNLFLGLLAAVVLFPFSAKALTLVDEDAAREEGQGYIGWNGATVVKDEEGVYNVKLGADVEGDFVVRDGETVVLDLNGYDLINYTKSVEAIKVYKDGKLTIKDTSEGEKGVVTHKEDSTYSVITNLGTLIIEGGKFTTDQNFYIVRNEGSLTISGGEFVSTSSNTSMLGNIKWENMDVTPTMVIDDGTFEANSAVIRNNIDSSLEINGGDLTSHNSYVVSNSASAVVNGGVLTSEKSSVFMNIINDEIEVEGEMMSATVETTLKVSDTAEVTSATDKNDYVVYDNAVSEDVSADYEFVTDENGNIVMNEKVEVSEPVDNPTSDDKEEENPDTSDSIITYIILGVVSSLALVITSIYVKKKSYN